MRAWRLFQSFERERRWRTEKERLREEALQGPTYGLRLKAVPRIRWYGF